MSDQMSYEAPRPSQNVLTVTIPLTYFNMLVETYYRGRREPEVQVVQPKEDAPFVNSNYHGINLLEDMPPGWTRVQKKGKPDGQ